MAGRRGNGEGSITKLKNGLWMGRVTIGRKKDGKLERKSLYGNTRAEVTAKMVTLQNEIQTGNYIASDMTLGTDIYTHIMLDIKRDAVNALDALYTQ